jgi:hypothetical protein
MPEDIRSASSPEEYWRLLRSKWGALASYRYIGRSYSGGRNEVVLRHDLRNAAGGIMAAPLCITSPESGGFGDEDSVPNPIIASLQIVDPARDVRAISTRGEVVHKGRQMGFSRTTIFDADNPDRVIALSSGAGVSIGAVPEGGGGQLSAGEGAPIEVEDRPDMPRLHEFFGGTRHAVGSWTLPPLGDEQASPDGALHLGPSHIILEAAAMDLANDGADTDQLQLQSWHVMFVARGKVGPFRTDGEAFDSGDGSIGCRVTLRDEGNGDRAVSVASALFARA